MTGALYLAALAAGAELARAMGNEKSAAKYRRLAEKGSRRLDRITWNGEYFVQKYDPGKAPKYQYGSGCLADQLLGQWFAMVVGLGHVLPREHVRRAIPSGQHRKGGPRESEHEHVVLRRREQRLRLL